MARSVCTHSIGIVIIQQVMWNYQTSNSSSAGVDCDPMWFGLLNT